MDPNYKKNVFINCPYDSEYLQMKRAMIFAVRYCGFIPWLVSMIQDAGRTRIQKINKLIDTSRLGIHDISRCQSTKKKEWYRMNMPFEMGLDFGCGTFSETHSDKHYLVLTKEPYTIQPALSDLSGNDPKCHGDNYEELMKIIRDFLYHQVEPENKKTFPQKNEIINDYLTFQTFLYTSYSYREDELKEMSDEEYSNKIEEFITGK